MPSEGPIRRSQLVAPFGVGALAILPNGVSVVAAGLDHWYKKLPGQPSLIDEGEFVIDEWRLARALGVNHFRLPPDYRRPSPGFGSEQTNLNLKVPFLRFPAWNFCPRCRRLVELSLESQSRRCESCASGSRRGWSPFLTQVPLVAICSYGHLLDFPWRQWVHRTLTPACQQQLLLRATGGASLAAQMVTCECGVRRNLAGVTQLRQVDGDDETVLSRELDDGGAEFRCPGTRPWHGTLEAGDCGRHVKASLRSASNLYYSLVKSSIYLPREAASVPPPLLEILGNPPLSTVLSVLVGMEQEVSASALRNTRFGNLLDPFDDGQVNAAIQALHPDDAPDGDSEPEILADAEDVEFRRVEYEKLRSSISAEGLQVEDADLSAYKTDTLGGLAKLTLVDQLRETRALWGFNRIYGENKWGLRDRKGLLRRAAPDWIHSWLPAYVVHGEGIFIELDSDTLAEWESRPAVIKRAAAVQRRFDAARDRRQLRPRTITARLLLLHTLGHVLMNQLTYECGYSSAALRERLFVSPGSMAGLLVYTASGDAEGTMGGLVRMGRPGYFEPAFSAALSAAEWCSADPVCMEIGEAGQGPDSCNLAACHMCALVPETACEEFNRFLDRGVLVGTHDNPETGYFRRAWRDS